MSSSATCADTASTMPTILKPPSDSRDYRYIELDNGLRAVLISDPSSEKGAAALDMGVGQMSDPEELPGLAHFLEHMLFLGTEKYPDETAYSSTLKKHGGSSNAYTQFEDTVYFFDVAAPALNELLDIFAQFFVAPLFTADATGRELNAVDSEHAKNMQVDVWRTMQLMRTTSSEDYPFSKFGTGSKETLETTPAEAGIDVRDALLAFHAKYYSAAIATLAVLGTESLDELEATVRTKFAAMPRTADARPVHRADGVVDSTNPDSLPFGDGGVGQWFSVVPVADARSVALWFPVLPCAPHYKTRPASVLGHLFGHESAGSILAALKAKDWATGLSAGLSGLATADFDIFTVSVDLTEAGEANVTEVVATIFAYADMVRAAGPAALEWVYDELVAMGKVSFAAKEPQAPLKTALSVASNLQRVAPEDVLAFSTLFLADAYDPEPVRVLLESLTPTNVRVLHLSKSVAPLANAEERWYGTSYEQHALDVAAVSKTAAELEVELSLPTPNLFIPTNLELKKLAGGAEAGETYAPVVIADTPLVKLWHKQDNTFATPKASVCVKIKTPLAYASPRSVVLTALAINMIKEELNTYAYFAEVAGLKFALAYDPQGMVVQVSGYSDKLPQLLEAVVGKLAAPALDSESVFLAQRDLMTRAYLNARKQQPYMHAFQAAKATLIAPEWTPEQKLAIIGSVKLADVVAFLPRLFAQFSLEALVHGNVTPDEALVAVTSLSTALTEAYCSVPLAAELAQPRRVVALGASRPGATAPLVVAELGPDADNANSAIYTVWQAGVNSPAAEAKVGLLGQVINQPAFHELRTKQQLGYIVDVSSSEMEGTVCVRAVIQSAVKDPAALDAALDAALADIRAELAQMSAEEFSQHVAARKLAVSERDKRLAQETNRFWGEISKERYVFDRVSQVVAALDAVSSVDQLLAWYDEVMVPANKASFYLYAAAMVEAGAKLPAAVDGVAFKRGAYLYPLP
ncbi:insulin-degrading enzyme [Thecamonas trahens ATCC 50062]|uniref:Insulin-degrading enzyme n=1 Tax=Thecamonas trahens ATCC 50062 TaxID=461836 RepID=A0A0L0DVM4_THETB|nr:insulin-degrading enzyme [Thecamonas trahens ATCC 50062]KNC56280.1 insulin-degrading enzyme [Thecamonas trahens ATCC 50062]|eukprot:XP_013760799.1 insulin-degrading enzyme [Thecamonas trahens ATCC 50062]